MVFQGDIDLKLFNILAIFLPIIMIHLQDGFIEFINQNLSLDHEQYCFVQEGYRDDDNEMKYKTVVNQCYESQQTTIENSIHSIYPIGKEKMVGTIN